MIDRRWQQKSLVVCAVAVLAITGARCRRESSEAKGPATPVVRPSILLVTLDTTRADAIGPEAMGIQTPAFNALAARGRRYRYAYATTPQTLPSHSSFMTGLYPAGHRVHENGRYLAADHHVLAEKLKSAGYRTAAFVSAFAVARRFGLARGFAVYDDDFGPDGVERNASATTERALGWLGQPSNQPRFLWVHYYDPHFPYDPPSPFRTTYKDKPYLGEVAFMDEQLGRLVTAFEESAGGPVGIVIVADHGEGLGDHGELQHGNLMYQSTMRVPLLLVGPGVAKGVVDAPVSTRRVFHTILDWAGLEAASSLRGTEQEVILGEAMKPFLDYGWQPQVMAVEGPRKAILSGGQTEIYDVVADPSEARNLGSEGLLTRGMRAAFRDYPIPSLQPAPAAAKLDDEERRKLAALGYVGSDVRPVVRQDAPRPRAMTHLFETLEEAAGLFVRGHYAQAIPHLEKILASDPHNLDAALRLASALSSLGRDREAVEAFEKARSIAPDSADVRTYLALHYARGKEWELAVPLLERIVAEDPDRLPATQALAVIRERQGRLRDAIQLRQKVYSQRQATPGELVRLGEMAMNVGETGVALASFEEARRLSGGKYEHHLELGVLYLAAGRLQEAKASLDRVPRSHPGYAMALFKRAQVSVLLREPDQAARIQAAKANADTTTRGLIARERLFQ